jgi:hypothetical protein
MRESHTTQLQALNLRTERIINWRLGELHVASKNEIDNKIYQHCNPVAYLLRTLCVLFCMKSRALVPLLFWGLSVSFHPTRSVAEDATTPGSSPAALSISLKQAGANAASLAGPATAAAIQSLGTAATSKQVAALVYAAVRAVPDAAVRIVRAAVGVAPGYAPEIAAAAVRAVPNPWKEVRYQSGAPQTPPPENAYQAASDREPDFKSAVDRSFVNALDAVLDPAAPGDPMSLAEAIVQAAADARGGADAGAIQGAVEAALFGDPAQLFNAVSGSKGISGVGDAGLSNYANEPFIPGTSTSAGKSSSSSSPPTTPSPSPVSP